MPGILGYPQVHSLIHKCLSLDPILRHINSVHAPIPSHINSVHAPTPSHYLKILVQHYTSFVLLRVSAQVQADCSYSYRMFHKNILCVFHKNVKPEYLLVIFSSVQTSSRITYICVLYHLDASMNYDTSSQINK